MTLSELMTKLEMARTQEGAGLNSEVKVKHGSDLAPNHYTIDAVVNGNSEVVIVCTWRTDDPERDGFEYRPS